MSLADDILDLTTKVTKKWANQRKAEERGHRSVNSRQYVYSDRVYFTEVAAEILPPACRRPTRTPPATAGTASPSGSCITPRRRRTAQHVQARDVPHGLRGAGHYLLSGVTPARRIPAPGRTSSRARAPDRPGRYR